MAAPFHVDVRKVNASQNPSSVTDTLREVKGRLLLIVRGWRCDGDAMMLRINVFIFTVDAGRLCNVSASHTRTYWNVRGLPNLRRVEIRCLAYRMGGKTRS